MTLIFGFGIMFQLPVVAHAAGPRRHPRRQVAARVPPLCDRRHLARLAAVLTPPDPFSMLAMALPTVLLYEASILIVDRVEKQRLAKEAATAEEA